MGWGDSKESGSTARLASSVRQYLCSGTTGDKERMAEALQCYEEDSPLIPPPPLAY